MRVSARFALPKGSKLVEKSVDRLGRGEDDPSELDGEPIDLVAKVVVVPDRSRARPSEGSERVQVLTQPELAGFLRSR